MKKRGFLVGSCLLGLMLGGTNLSAYAEETTSQEVATEVLEVQPDVAVPVTVKTLSMYRLYNPNNGEHFYTASGGERTQLVQKGWKYEGIGWEAPETGIPVYRLYNPNAGDHHYTTSGGEKTNLVNVGWKYEGIGWYSSVNEETPIYRAYNPNAKAGSHNYTASILEQSNLVEVGWFDENIGWYAVSSEAEAKGPKSTVTFQYIDAEGKAVLPETSDANVSGVVKTYTAPLVTGYMLRSEAKKKIRFTDSNQIVQFIYEKEPNLGIVEVKSGAEFLITPMSNRNYVVTPKDNVNTNLSLENTGKLQKFRIQAVEDGWYQIKNDSTGMVLQVAETGSRSLQQGGWRDADSQKFQFLDAGGNQFYIRSKVGGYVEVVGDVKEGSALQAGNLTMQNSQKFYLENVSDGSYVRSTQLNATTARVTLFSQNQNFASVSFPTWSNENGQDDIKWLAGSRNADGSWSVTVDAKDFKNGGMFSTHAYGKNASGTESTFLGSTSYNLERPALSQVKSDATYVLSVVGQDLKAAYNWAVGLSYSKTPEPGAGQNLPDYYGLEGFSKKNGNCYVYAAVFYHMAKILNYDATFVTGTVNARGGGTTPHGWVEININGTVYVFDPEAQSEIKGYNGYQLRYGGSGTLQYRVTGRHQGADY